MKFGYRPATIGDCFRLAELVMIASGGMIEFLFHDLVPHMSPLQILVRNLERDDAVYSYKSAVVAECGRKTVGTALSYPSRFHRISTEMRKFFPEDRLHHLESFYSARVDDSLYLDAICVDQEFRGKGMGSELLSLTKKKGEQGGYPALSLIVLADNTDAQRLYRRHGFEEVKKVDLKPHELMPHEGGCLLMNCTLEDE